MTLLLPLQIPRQLGHALRSQLGGLLFSSQGMRCVRECMPDFLLVLNDWGWEWSFRTCARGEVSMLIM